MQEEKLNTQMEANVGNHELLTGLNRKLQGWPPTAKPSKDGLGPPIASPSLLRRTDLRIAGSAGPA